MRVMRKAHYIPQERRLAICFCFVDIPSVVEKDLQDARRLGQHGGFYKMPLKFYLLRNKGGWLIIGSSAMGSKV